MSQIKGGVALNYLTVLLTNLLGLVITPLMIRKMGTSEYGLYTLIGAFVGYLLLFDFGLNNTVVRFVAKYRALKDEKSEKQFVATTLFIYIALAAAMALVGLGIYFNLDIIFGTSLTPEELEKARIMFLILVANVAVTLPGSIFMGICYGYERFVFPKAVNVLRYVIRAGMIIVLLELGYKALAIVVLDTIMNFLLISVNGAYVFTRLKLRFGWKDINTRMLSSIFSYSFWIFVYAIVMQIQWKGGQVVLGIEYNTTLVAIFAVGVTLGGYYGAFSTAVSSVFLPRATKMVMTGASNSELTDAMIRIGRISFHVLVFILLAFVLFGQEFILLWVGEEYRDSWIIALIIMIAYTVPLTQSFGNSILEAKRKLAFKAVVFLIFLILGTAAGAILALRYETIGMIVGIAVFWVIAQQIMNWYYHKEVGIQIIRFFKELTHKVVPTALLIALLGYFLNWGWSATGWVHFVGKIAVYSALYLPLMFLLGMRDNERDLIRGALSVLKQMFRSKRS